MLKGYMVPRSPLGQASIDPPPPWHYSGDVLAVEFWADPAATTSMLPEGLSPDPSTNGHAFAMFVDWQFTASDDEYLDPARYQYREAFVLIDAELGSRPVTFCPKKLGSIFQTRTHAAPSPAASPVKPGARFGASLSAHGCRLADARVTLRQPAADPFTVFNRPTALVRYFPRLGKGQQDQPAVNELTVFITDDLRLVDLWRGEGQLSFPRAPGEELHALGPTKVGAGFRYGLSYSVTDLEIVKDFAK